MMKKFLAALLVAMLLMTSCLVVHADSTETKFGALLLPMFDKSLSTWMSSESNRGLFVATMAVEILANAPDHFDQLVLDAISGGDCYVAMSPDRSMIVVLYFSDSGFLLAVYGSTSQNVEVRLGYNRISNTAAMMASLQADGMIGTYYLVPDAAIWNGVDTVGALVDSLSK